MPVGEKTWAPFGYALAVLFKSFSLSEFFWATSYKSLWLIHMINTMAFVAIIPYSKFFHFIAIPFAALVKPDRKPPVLKPMDFEESSACELEDAKRMRDLRRAGRSRWHKDVPAFEVPGPLLKEAYQLGLRWSMHPLLLPNSTQRICRCWMVFLLRILILSEETQPSLLASRRTVRPCTDRSECRRQ